MSDIGKHIIRIPLAPTADKRGFRPITATALRCALSILYIHGDPMVARDVATYLGCSYVQACHVLNHLAARGLVKKQFVYHTGTHRRLFYYSIDTQGVEEHDRLHPAPTRPWIVSEEDSPCEDWAKAALPQTTKRVLSKRDAVMTKWGFKKNIFSRGAKGALSMKHTHERTIVAVEMMDAGCTYAEVAMSFGTRPGCATFVCKARSRYQKAVLWCSSQR